MLCGPIVSAMSPAICCRPYHVWLDWIVW